MIKRAHNFKEYVSCRVCLEEKHWELFPFNKKRNKRQGRICKKCNFEKINVLYKSAKARYRAMKKDYCEKCGFRGHSCQLDINHKDGNHENNDPENIETLCSNCHRLVTFEKKHGMYQYRGGKKIEN